MLAYFVVRRWSKTFRGRHEDVDKSMSFMLAYFVVRSWSKTFRGRHEDVDKSMSLMLAYFVVRRWSKTFRGRHEDVVTRVCHSCLLTLLCDVGIRHSDEDMKML